MKPQSSTPETPSERLVRDIRRATRKQYSAEEKIRIVLDGLRGEVSIADSAVGRVSPRACITVGRRSSWKPASAGWPVTRRDVLRVNKRPYSNRKAVTGSRREARKAGNKPEIIPTRPANAHANAALDKSINTGQPDARAIAPAAAMPATILCRRRLMRASSPRSGIAP